MIDERKDVSMLITFDLDGVLMLNPFGSGVFPHVRRIIAEESGANETNIRLAIVAEARGRQEQGLLVEAYDWDAIITKVAKDFGVTWNTSIAGLVEFYCRAPHIRRYPGALELLSDLTSQGHHLRSLTNGYHKYQYPVLKALGLAHFFERILTPEQAGFAKPQPEFYAWARQGANLPHVHIGDTVIHDIWGANLGGAISIWINPDLPQTWQTKTPWERARASHIQEIVQEAIDKDLCPHCYPGLKVEDALPQFVVSHLSEIPLVLEQIAAKTWA